MAGFVMPAGARTRWTPGYLSGWLKKTISGKFGKKRYNAWTWSKN